MTPRRMAEAPGPGLGKAGAVGGGPWAGAVVTGDSAVVSTQSPDGADEVWLACVSWRWPGRVRIGGTSKGLAPGHGARMRAQGSETPGLRLGSGPANRHRLRAER